MSNEELLSHVDHTLLNVDATWDEIVEIIEDGMKYKTASICIPPSFVAPAAEYIAEADSELSVCTVIGFPNGYSTTAVKAYEAEEAVQNGASEIDMVVNVGWVKENRWDWIIDEINEVKEACGEKTLKVIIESCLLTEEEIVAMCQAINHSHADFIKTSTGFSTGGATFEVISLMAEHMSKDKKIKAAGGISTLDDARHFLELGADRLGSSRVVKLIKAGEK
ncbi:MAG: deoxyribose-phosphate aldolase [Lachnospiraceae bacterium]|nr:deoxyribose-phosphate aldolase [Lachnospiraceae bacterium]